MLCSTIIRGVIQVAGHILVIDDDPKITTMLARGLGLEGYEVDTANNGDTGLKKIMSSSPDLVILDLMMPGVDGWEVCRRVRSQGLGVPILMLTARDEVKDRVHGLEIGADDYLVKPFAFEELLARVKALLRRSQQEPKVLRFSDLILDLGERRARRGQRVIDLTTKEFELLSMFMQHPRQVLTRDAIMEEIWGFDFEGESNVLEVYVGYLRHKLEEGGEPRLLHTVRGAGYVLREPSGED